MQHCSFWSTLGDLFLKFVPSMKFYSDFINAYDEGMSLMMEATKKNKELNEYLNVRVRFVRFVFRPTFPFTFSGLFSLFELRM